MLAFEYERRNTKEQIPTKGRPKVKFNSLEEELKAVWLVNKYLKKRVAKQRVCTVEELNFDHQKI